MCLKIEGKNNSSALLYLQTICIQPRVCCAQKGYTHSIIQAASGLSDFIHGIVFKWMPNKLAPLQNSHPAATFYLFNFPPTFQRALHFSSRVAAASNQRIDTLISFPRENANYTKGFCCDLPPKVKFMIFPKRQKSNFFVCTSNYWTKCFLFNSSV